MTAARRGLYILAINTKGTWFSSNLLHRSPRAIHPEGSAVGPEGSAVGPEGSVVCPEGCAIGAVCSAVCPEHSMQYTIITLHSLIGQ